MGFFANAHRELGQEKYDEMEAKLLDQAAVLFDNKVKEAVCQKKMEAHTPNIQNNVVRRRKKEKGFNMSPTLQVVGLDFCNDSESEQDEEIGLNEWIEELKKKRGYEKGFCRMVDEVQQEVIKFFDKALRESGRPCVKWIHKATSYMLSKIEGYEEKKKARVEPVKVGKWVDLLKEEVHLEDENEMAKKACIILVEIMKASQKGDVLGPGTDLGRQLQGHKEFLGGKICMDEGTPLVCENARINEPNAPVETEQVQRNGQEQVGRVRNGVEIEVESLNEGGSSGRSKGRKRKKKKGFRVGNALQILALDYGDQERLDGLEKWIEELKEKVGHDEELVQAVDEAYEEVLELFEEALEELGLPGDDMDDELVCKAALIFWKKWEKIIQTSKELREAHAASKGNERGESSGEQGESVGGEKEGERACGSDKEECDIVGEEIDSGFREKEGECYASSEEEANVEYEEEANVEDGEYVEYEFNCDEWLDWLEGKLRFARGVNWMNEVLKEIYSYMQVVYDEQQQVYWEEESSMALKAYIILREVVRVSPMRGCLHPESDLGCHLLMNQEMIGWRLCRWAWRRFRSGWEENLMRLDVNSYCN
nr:hypothetical protein Iba_chr09dCG16310 [Ipomoea batatas]